MSKANVKRFYDTIATDIEMRKRIIEANKKYKGCCLTESELERLMAEEFLPLLKQEGYSFTLDELTEYQNEVKDRKGNIEEYKLKNISGGINRNQAIRNLFNILS